MQYSIVQSIVSEHSKFLPYEGKQIGFNKRYFALGDMCEKANLPWYRAINANPSTDEWQALFACGLAENVKHRLQGSTSDRVGVSVVVGAPHHLVERFTKVFPKAFRGAVDLEVPEKPYTLKANVEEVVFVPEVGGHAWAYAKALDDYCLVISLGFGTVEVGAASAKGGAMPDTFDSFNYGLHQAVPAWRQQLLALGFDNPNIRGDQFHYWDRMIQRVIDKDDSLVIRTPQGDTFTWQDLHDIAVKALQTYAQNLKMHLKPYFSRFNRKMRVVIGGGGLNQHPVVEVLKEMLADLQYETTEPDRNMAKIAGAYGYKLIAEDFFRKKGIGIEVGNFTSSTVVK